MVSPVDQIDNNCKQNPNVFFSRKEVINITVLPNSERGDAHCFLVINGSGF